MRGVPIIWRSVVVGGGAGGLAGGVAGLVIGLRVHAATAWFAVFELGVPVAAAGATVGFVVGVVRWCAGSSRRSVVDTDAPAGGAGRRATR